MALVPSETVEIYDAFQERLARCLWVSEAAIVPYPEVRSAKLERRAMMAAAAPAGAVTLRTLQIGYDKSKYEEEERLRMHAEAQVAKSADTQRIAEVAAQRFEEMQRQLEDEKEKARLRVRWRRGTGNLGGHGKFCSFVATH